MAKKRQPNKMDAIGVGVWIKDPAAATGSLFKKYVRVPGLGAFTGADPDQPTTASVGLDGAVQSAGFGEPGTITAPIAMKGQHPAHRFLAQKRRDKKPILVAWRRPARNVIFGGATTSTNKLGALMSGVAEPTGTLGKILARQLIEGRLISIGNAAALTATTQAGLGFVDYGVTPETADQLKFRVIVDVTVVNGLVTEFTVAPGFKTDVAGAAGKFYSILDPGTKVIDVEASVTGYPDGDFQAGAVVTGNLTLAPSLDVPVDSVDIDIDEDVAPA